MGASTDSNGGNNFVYYRYHPSLAAAVIFMLLFFSTTIFHIYQTGRKRSWFLIPFIIGGIFESIGYIGRIMSSHNQYTLGPFIMQSLLLLVAPALFAASIYMILGRIIRLTDGERFCFIRPSWMTKIFVAGDVISFFAQGAGGGIMSGKAANAQNLGKTIIMVGLWIQVVFFGFFVIVALFFQRRGRAHLQAISATVPWKRYMYALYATSGLILVRSAFRIVEYTQGNAGYLLRHEVFLYVFDGLLMFAVMVIMNVIHPGDIAPMLKEKEGRKGGATMPLV